MAKRTTGTAFKGEFNLGSMEIVEVQKESVDVYDLLEELRFYDGKTISIAIREEKPVEPKTTK